VDRGVVCCCGPLGPPGPLRGCLGPAAALRGKWGLGRWWQCGRVFGEGLKVGGGGRCSSARPIKLMVVNSFKSRPTLTEINFSWQQDRGWQRCI
jgi:hypothetical protein